MHANDMQRKDLAGIKLSFWLRRVSIMTSRILIYRLE